jgi:deoxycytidylate deaminase
MSTTKKYHIIATCYNKRGHILSTATNSYTKTHPIQAHFAALAKEPARIYLHAEILAILRAGDSQIHTISIQNLSSPIGAYPCKVCQKAIAAYGIKKVVVLSSTD